MDFTSAQRSAIDARGSSLLVSAGAGSGKTRVLTERIIERLLEDGNGADITKYLVVTFTRAAASELSDRIRKALTDIGAVRPDDKRVLNNIALLPQAKICTIDSFCYDIVRDNFQKLGLSSKLRIAEKSETDVIRNRIIDEIIEDKFKSENGSEYFLTLLENFASQRSTENFTKMIREVHDKLRSFPSRDQYFETAYSAYVGAAEGEIYDSFYGALLKDHTKTVLENARKTVQYAAGLCEGDEDLMKKYLPSFQADIENIKIIEQSVEGGYRSAYEALRAYDGFVKCGQIKNYPDPKKSKYIRDVRLVGTKAVEALRDNFYIAGSEAMAMCAEDHKHLIDELRSIITELDERFEREKAEAGILDFSDVEAFALRLLYDDAEKGVRSSLAKDIADSFEEVYIDEYQDISPVQDMIFRAVTKTDAEGREINRFLVGDSKQCIYLFRGSRPEIFDRYRSSFSELNTENPGGKKVFMQNNFRCSENVIEFVNSLFGDIMPEDYSDSDKLIYSRHEENKSEYPVKLMVAECDEMDENTVDVRGKVEAEMVVREIKKIVGNPDYRAPNGKMYGYSDVAILTRTVKSAKMLEAYFRSRNIPVECEVGESFYGRKEVRTALCALGAIDNPERDVDLVGFMRSKAAGFDDDELALIRKHCKSGSFYSAVKNYAESEDGDGELKNKLNNLMDTLTSLREKSRACSVSEFIRKAYASLDLINVCTSDAFGSTDSASKTVRRKNLEKLYDMARSFDKYTYKGLSEFLDHIKFCIEKKDDLKSASAGRTDMVRIMTVHASKGLEFPVCFLVNTDREFNDNIMSERCVVSEKYGISFKLKNLEKITSCMGSSGLVISDNPYRKLSAMYEDRLSVREEKRLLYVALTRARDMLIVTAAPANYKSVCYKMLTSPDDVPKSEKSFLEWITRHISSERSVRRYLEGYKEYVPAMPDEAYTDGKKPYELVIVNDTEKLLDGGDSAEIEAEPIKYESDPELLKKLRDVMSRRKAACGSIQAIPPKLTVSMLKYGLIDYEDTEDASEEVRNLITVPEFVSEGLKATASEKGTAMHMFMQFADYEKCETEGAEKQAQRLADEGFISEKQREMLDIGKLDAFFSTDLYARIKAAKAVHRELRFNLKASAAEVMANAPETDDFVLVQGVIDCFIENADGSYTVVDFKTDKVGSGGEDVLRERYSGQLGFYCKAVEDITKKEVSDAVIFSFDMMKEIKLNTKDIINIFSGKEQKENG